jgi:hypothetical protein
MPVCDYCGEGYFRRKADYGSLHFCSKKCREQGKVLEILEAIPSAAVSEQIRKARLGPCPECGADAPIEAHKSYIAGSFIIATSYKTTVHICCRRCAKRHQWEAIRATMVGGWWGLPWGLIMTPTQIIRNLLAMRSRADGHPSWDFIRIVRLNLARAVASSNQRSR